MSAYKLLTTLAYLAAAGDSGLLVLPWALH
jgi:hypothetical protein